MLSLGSCGGALISPRIVLSAYHCIYKGDKRAVILGHDTIDYTILLKEGGINNYYSIPIMEIKHSKPLNQKDDVGILILESPAKFSGKIQPICLPEQDQDFSDVTAVTAGWGLIAKKTLAPELRKLDLKVDDKKYWSMKYENMLGTKVVKNKDGEYQDPCAGDSGALKLILKIQS